MSIPGSNILNMALSVIAKQAWQWFSFNDRITQSNGQYMGVYNAPLTIQGSSQAVSRALYQQYGLDFNKYYQKFFVSRNVIDVSRDVSGDLFVFNGQTYQCLSITPWYAIDGWVEVLTSLVVNTPLITSIIAPADGDYITAAPLTFIINYNAPVTVSGTPEIPLAALAGIIGGNALYISGSGTNSLAFQYTVQNTDTANGLTTTPPIDGGSILSVASNNIPASTGYIAPDLSGITLNGG